MEPAEKLADLRDLHAAVLSNRNSLIKSLNDRHWRTRRVKNCVARIRALRVALVKSMHELVGLLNRTATLAAIEAADIRLGELRSLINHQEKRTLIDRMLRLKAQMDAMNEEMPHGMRLEDLVHAAPAEPDMSDDIDDDLIFS